MKKAYNKIINKYIFSDDLSFDACVFNLVSIVGFCALLVSAIGHIFEHSNMLMMIVKIVMISGALMLIWVSNKYNMHKYGRVFIIVGFCDILFPLMFFMNGGSYGGIAAYFVLTMILIFLMSRGVMLVASMVVHLAIVISCYLVDRYYHDFIVPIDNFQHYADNLISIIVAGAFIGFVVKGISALLIRERIKAEAASKAKGDFLSQMSHEMRTPLNAIIGMSSIILTSDGIDQQKVKANVKEIETASTHLLGVINDILDMSKIEAHKLELLDESFNFRKMIDGVITIMNYNIENKNQKLLIDIDSNIPSYFRGDSQRLAQVFTNLLSNAIKFTSEGGSICLKAELAGKNDNLYSIRTTVVDTGIGITDEQKRRLFKSFEQADNSTSRRFGGTGLGLAISKQIVELMGGHIWVDSESGKGSTFTFDVILPGGEAVDEDIGQPDAPSYDFAGKRILIAEDIEINREIIATLLEPTDITIEFAENGKEAVRMVEASSGKYDLIFMDIQMPEMNGYQATRAIRASTTSNASNIPIIAMTANVFNEDIDKAMATGMDGHIGKPIDLNKVLHVLGRYLS